MPDFPKPSVGDLYIEQSVSREERPEDKIVIVTGIIDEIHINVLEFVRRDGRDNGRGPYPRDITKSYLNPDLSSFKFVLLGMNLMDANIMYETLRRYGFEDAIEKLDLLLRDTNLEIKPR